MYISNFHKWNTNAPGPTSFKRTLPAPRKPPLCSLPAPPHAAWQSHKPQSLQRGSHYFHFERHGLVKCVFLVCVSEMNYIVHTPVSGFFHLIFCEIYLYYCLWLQTSFTLLYIIPLCDQNTIIQPSYYLWTFGQSPGFDYYDEYCHEHSNTYVLALLLGIYLWIELLGVRVCICFTLVDTAKYFPKVFGNTYTIVF